MTQLEALALTLVFEGAAGACCGRWLQRPPWQPAICFAAASLCTHPLVWTLNELWSADLAFAPRAAILEVGATLAEAAAAIFALRLPAARALAASAVANGTSFGLGLVLWALGVGH